MSQPSDFIQKGDFKSALKTSNVSDLISDKVPVLTQHPPLTKDETKEALVLINKKYSNLKFPRVTRLDVDPPVGNQNYFVSSFLPAPGATPDKNGIYGLFKFRGAFTHLYEAEARCENIISTVDSNNELAIGYPGKWFPLSNDDKLYDVDEVTLKEAMDSTVKDMKRKKREMEMNEIREVEKRRDELYKDTKDVKDQCIDDLDIYITLRTKRATLRQYLDELDKKKAFIAGQIQQQTKELETLDKKYPQYSKDFMKKYTEQLRSIGTDEKESPLIKYM